MLQHTRCASIINRRLAKRIANNPFLVFEMGNWPWKQVLGKDHFYYISPNLFKTMRELRFDELSFVSGADDPSGTDKPAEQATDGGATQTVNVSAPRPTTCEPGMYVSQIVYTNAGPTISGNISGTVSAGTNTSASGTGGVTGTYQATTTQTTCVSPTVTCKLDDGTTITRPGGPDTCNVYRQANSSR